MSEPGLPECQDSEGGLRQSREVPLWPVWPRGHSHPREHTQPLRGDGEVRSPGIEPWEVLAVLLPAHSSNKNRLLYSLDVT